MRSGEEVRPLSDVAVEVLATVVQHRIVSTRQVHAIHTPQASRRWAQRILADLEQRGLVASFRKGHAKLWHATPRGVELLQTAGDWVDERPKVLSPEQASGQLWAHTLAVNEVGIAFLRAARNRGDDFGPLSWRHEVAHPLTRGRGRRRRQLIADALLTYLVFDNEGLALEYRFVELDRATLPTERVVAKLARYPALYSATDERGEPIWRAWYPTFPFLHVVLAGGSRLILERRRQTLIALCRSHPILSADSSWLVSFCLLADLQREGPFGRIFFSPEDPQRAVNWLGKGGEATTDPEGQERHPG